MIRQGCLIIIMVLASCSCISDIKRQFSVDYKRNCFVKDGNCTNIISGSMHYVRVPFQYWEDRIAKFRAAGLNTVETYVPWFVHEPYPGRFYFQANANITAFLNLTAKYGLNVILRPGPYICAEFDLGGLPWWLLKLYPGVKLRTSDKRYLAEVDKYFNVLLLKIKPHLYVNGGNIINIQVENEYGAYDVCDKSYTKHLRDLFRKLVGPDVLLTTIDQSTDDAQTFGNVPGVFPTVDFGVSSLSQVKRYFAIQQNYSKGGPRMVTELWDGWMDVWRDAHSTVYAEDVVSTMEYVWKLNGSFNLYMFHGGTNFGYLNGAHGNMVSKFQTMVTSYDYDAPISEAGDPTPKYHAIRDAVEKYTGTKIPYPVPPASKKYNYGSFELKRMGSLYDFLDILAPKPYLSTYPVPVEAINHPYGFTLYQTTVSTTGSQLRVQGIRDRGYLIKNNRELLSVLQRPYNGSLNLETPLKPQDKLAILVENQGRICYGPFLNDSKGIVGNVTLDSKILTKWAIYKIGLEQLFRNPDIRTRKSRSMKRHPRKVETNMTSNYIPSLYQGTIKLDSIGDTFFNPEGWGKGQVLINGINIGRYWPSQGPQVTLFVPGSYLRNTTKVILFELDSPGCFSEGCRIGFTDKPKLSL